MKRILLSLLVVLLIGGVFVYLQRRLPPHARQVAGWLPGDTILFEDLPDTHRTAERWPDTELAQIAQEPEIQALLARPAGQLPDLTQMDDFIGRLRKVDPAHLFVAMTKWPSGGVPSVVAGVDIAGSRDEMDAMVGDLRKRALQNWPQAHSDIVKYGSGDIETFTAPTFTAALAYRGNWFFIATDADLLKSTLDKVEGQHDPNSLAELPSFKTSLSHLPPAADSIFFFRPTLLADQLASLALMVNPTADVHSQGAEANLKKIDAIAIGMKLDGPIMRDASFAMYTSAADAAPVDPMARDALRLSSSDTIILLSRKVELNALGQMPDAKADPTGMIALVESWVGSFSQQGLGTKEFNQAFGPEAGFVLDWGSSSLIPEPLAMIDVRDTAVARKFLDTLADQSFGDSRFTRQEDSGITYYSLPSTSLGLFPVQFTLGLTKKAVIAGLGQDPIQQGSQRWDTSASKLDSTEVFKKADDLVSQPTASFTYVDTGAVFGRVYGMVRGVAAMGFIPHLADYVDLSKLPAPETITKHLTPLVSSSSIKDGGLLTESAGPVTVSQGVVVAAAAFGAVAFPMIEEQAKGQPVTIPGLPGFNLNSMLSPSAPTPQMPVPFPTPSTSTPATSPDPASTP
jgi:hypothetical protein